MSRRKQAKPRHFQEDEDGVPLKAEKDMPDLEKGVATECEEDTTNGDAHVCGKCRQEFLNLEEFIEHKKSCEAERIVLPVYNEENKMSDNFDDQDDFDDEDIGDEEDLIGQEDFDDNELEEGEIDMTDAEHQAAKDGADSAYDSKCSDKSDSDCNKDLVNSEIKDGTTENDKDPQFPYNDLAPLLAQTHVTMEKLEGTKAAVSQFAENNLPAGDLQALQSTLFNLHQQQMMQLNLIQQLQNQFIANGGNPNQIPKMLSQLKMENPSLMKLPTSTESTPTSSASVSPSSSTSSTQKEASSTPLTSTSEPPMVPTSELPLMNLTKMASNNPMGGTTPFDILRQEAQIPHGDDPFRKGKPPNVNLFGIETNRFTPDDPFFRHRCKYCGKVFSSNKALEIHIRSHTGERPYKCNVCHNRFSTKGNLKVHFSRHRMKYPHLRMNPNPVPEHLDKYDKPIPMMPPGGPISEMAPSPQRSRSVSPDLENENMSDDERYFSESPHENEKRENFDMKPHSDPPKSSLGPLERLSNVSASLATSTNLTSSMTPTIPIPSTIGPLPHMIPPMPFDPMFFPQRLSILPPSQVEDPMEQYMECSKSETSKLQQLVENIEQKLSDPNQCAICHRILSCKSALQMHYRIHTGERPFKCKICGRAFTTKGNLKTHMGVHRAKPPMRMMHQCPVCHKQFTNALVLQQHIRIHTEQATSEMFAKQMEHLKQPMMTGHPFYQLPNPHMAPGGELDLSKPKRSTEDDDELESPNDHERRESRELRSPRSDSEAALNYERERLIRERERFIKSEMERKMMLEMESERSHSLPKSQEDHEDSEKDRQSVHSEDLRRRGSCDEQPTSLVIHDRSPRQGDTPLSLVNHDREYHSSHDREYHSSHDRERHGSRERDQHASHEKEDHGNHDREQHGNHERKHHGNHDREHHLSESKHEKFDDEDNSANKRDRRSPSTEREAKDEKKPNHHPALPERYPFPHMGFPGEFPMYPFGHNPFAGLGSPFLPGQHNMLATSGMMPSFSTSLAALEERVKAVSAVSPAKPPKVHSAHGHHFNHSPSSYHHSDNKHLDNNNKRLSNGERAHSPISDDNVEDNLAPSPRRSPFRSRSREQSPTNSHATNESFNSDVSGSPLDHGIPMTHPYDTLKSSTTCNICMKTFACRSALDIHYRSHTKVRPFGCSTCEKAFTTRGNLRQHMLTHKSQDSSPEPRRSHPQESAPELPHPMMTSPATHVAPVISPSTPMPQSLTPKRPPAIDQMTNPYPKRNSKHLCQVCIKNFSSASALQIHMRTHTGDKPFKCTVCGKAFTTKGNLKACRDYLDTIPLFPWTWP
ncbi:unnamed protein product [Owenia fusiformis]|uniref:Sal-like protein 1 n=1 Tax=Owenia fusiformis TaxID=6347 RepID=A0A8S4NER3_OWEFU|nr:unnamed protein product [Owenia fusiformis]